MARFSPLIASTYDSARVAPEAVISPPYDVVSAEERAALVERSPYNAIQVELPIDPAGGDPYEHATSLWKRWHEEGVITTASTPGYYAYRMSFTAEDGQQRSSTGVLGALGLDPSHTGEVLPHEETTPKDAHDRLSLLRAARTNFSPIWGLSLASGLADALIEVTENAGPDFSAFDDDGVLHERWTLTGPTVVETITGLVGSTPILIADGHHRYETACRYCEQAPSSKGASAVLAFVVELSERELSVQPIHRLISGVGDQQLLAGLGEWFDISPGPSTAFELQLAMAEQGALGLVLGDGRTSMLAPRARLAEAAPDDLDSSFLKVALEASLLQAVVTYQHGVTEVERAVTEQSGGTVAAVLLRPVSIDQIARTAHGGRRMPPKSTFFYPKPRTGVVFRELDLA